MMEIDPQILRATIADLVLQVISLQSQVKALQAKLAEQEKQAAPPKEP